MILLLAIIIGLLAGVSRAWLGDRKLAGPTLRFLWIVPLAFFPQFIAFQFPTTRSGAESWIPVALIGSLIFLLIFVAFNVRQPGFWLLGLGLFLNLTVIARNGGWMPISPETIALLMPNAAPGSYQIGERLGITKDKVLSPSQTNLGFLSDRFILPSWSPYQVAFSIGDVMIALGAIWFLWSLGGPSRS